MKKNYSWEICSYNNSTYLKSVSRVFLISLFQRFFNVILIDDKSDDNSLEITNIYKKKILNYQNFKNLG